jgi:hypothetical protein
VPTENDHIAKGDANVAFANSLGTERPQLDWKIIAWFYADLHYVEAALIRAGVPSGTHRERREAMRKVAALKTLVGDYESLQNFSKLARYDPCATIGGQQGQAICDIAADIKARLGH